MGFSEIINSDKNQVYATTPPPFSILQYTDQKKVHQFVECSDGGEKLILNIAQELLTLNL